MVADQRADAADPRPRTTQEQDRTLVEGVRCVDCGYAVGFARRRCPRCRGHVETARFGPLGTVWSSTVVRVPVPGRVPPYTLAYVDLEQDGPRVLAHVRASSADPEPTRIGATVRLVARTDSGDLQVEEATS